MKSERRDKMIRQKGGEKEGERKRGGEIMIEGERGRERERTTKTGQLYNR